jgi:hypothetical protein
LGQGKTNACASTRDQNVSTLKVPLGLGRKGPRVATKTGSVEGKDDGSVKEPVEHCVS